MKQERPSQTNAEIRSHSGQPENVFFDGAVMQRPEPDKVSQRLCRVLAASGVLAAIMLPIASQAQLINPEQNEAQRSMSLATQKMCPNLDANSPTSEGALKSFCDDLVGQNYLDTNETYQRVNGEELQALQQQVAEVSDNQLSLIAGRLNAIRAGLAGPGISFAGLSIDTGDRILAASYDEDLLIGEGGTLEDEIWSRLGIFATGGTTFGDKNNTGKVTGYDFYSTGLTLGADYRLTDELVFGGAVGYSYYDVDFDNNSANASNQELDSNSALFHIFGSYFLEEGFFFDAVGTFGWSYYDIERRVVAISNGNDPDTVSIDRRANSDTDAFLYSFAGNVGYELDYQGFLFTPVARAQYVKANISGYEESGASPINLRFSSQDAKSLTTNLGMEIGYPVSTEYGIVQASIRGEWIHEFENDEDGVPLRYASDTTALSSFNVITENTDEDYGVVGASVTGTFAGGWSGFADFDTIVGLSDFDIYTLRVGMRREF